MLDRQFSAARPNLDFPGQILFDFVPCLGKAAYNLGRALGAPIQDGQPSIVVEVVARWPIVNVRMDVALFRGSLEDQEIALTLEDDDTADATDRRRCRGGEAGNAPTDDGHLASSRQDATFRKAIDQVESADLLGMDGDVASKAAQYVDTSVLGNPHQAEKLGTSFVLGCWLPRKDHGGLASLCPALSEGQYGPQPRFRWSSHAAARLPSAFYELVVKGIS